MNLRRGPLAWLSRGGGDGAHGSRRAGCPGLSPEDGSQSFGQSGHDVLRWPTAFQREVVAGDPGGLNHLLFLTHSGRSGILVGMRVEYDAELEVVKRSCQWQSKIKNG